MTISTTLAQRPQRLTLLACFILLTVLPTGCGSKPTQNPATAAQNQERETLLAENQDFARVSTENEEVKRLKKENQDLPKLRSQYQEALRLRKDNEQLRQQITKISPSAGTNLTAIGTGQGGALAGSVQSGGPEKEKQKELAQDENTLNEGDEILIDPKQLKQLLPDFDWEKLPHKEPLGVRSLLEKGGVQLTNLEQLKEFGLTNYTIRRAPPAPPPAAAEPR